MSDQPTADEAPGGADEGLDPATQRRVVRERYGAIAAGDGESAESGGSTPSGCCGTDADDAGTKSASSGCSGPDAGSEPATDATDDEYAATLGYTDDDVDAVADGANLGLGCGNPTAIASLGPGETVLDLGSGAGFDCFLAAQEVGQDGRVIGVDMTPEMVERARENVVRNGAGNVEFRLGEIEHLPVADESVDVAISNCVINLSPNKPQVYREAFRVLRPGGRLSVSDVVLTAPVPTELRGDPDSVVGCVAGCVAGAAPAEEVDAVLRDAGFADVAVEFEDDSDEIVSEWDDQVDLAEFVVSAQITGRKPASGEPAAGGAADG